MLVLTHWQSLQNEAQHFLLLSCQEAKVLVQPTFMQCELSNNAETNNLFENKAMYVNDVSLSDNANTHDDDVSLPFYDDVMSCED